MSKFDEIINSKYQQLDEAIPGTSANPGQTPGATNTPQQTSATPVRPQNPMQQNANLPKQDQVNQQNQQQPEQQQQQPEQQQQVTPEQDLTKAFQAIKFGDPNIAVQAMNTALKSAGNVPGMKEFFSSLAFDPNKGFMVAQTNQQPNIQ